MSLPLDAPAERPTTTRVAPPEPLIRIDAVQKQYEMGAAAVQAVRGISLEIARGALVVVTGRSGSGKSTLLHLLAAMEQPSSGSIQVGSWDLGRLDAGEQARYRREMIGMVFQQFNLIPTMTALHNVALPLMLGGEMPATREARARLCLEQVGLGHRLHHRPAELSGGEQQRVAIARALVYDPPLLLADEPTGNLDSTTGAQIIELLARVHRDDGKTIVIVTHHPDDVVPLADQVITLHDGHLTAPAT